MNDTLAFEEETFHFDGAGLELEPETTWEIESPEQSPEETVRRFSSNTGCVDALRKAGKTKEQALAIINAQIALAIRMLRLAADRLKQDARTPRTKAIFHKIFRVQPDFVPTWFKPTASLKDRGDVVAVRCRRVADLLASGTLKLFCSINSTDCPDCGNDNSDFACSSWGDESVAPRRSNVICLGAPFWDDMRAGNASSLRSTLMHEPFHIYFGKYVTAHERADGKSVGKFGGITCIVRFVFEINNQTPPQRVIDRCKATVVRSAATGYGP